MINSGGKEKRLRNQQLAGLPWVFRPRYSTAFRSFFNLFRRVRVHHDRRVCSSAFARERMSSVERESPSRTHVNYSVLEVGVRRLQSMLESWRAGRERVTNACCAYHPSVVQRRSNSLYHVGYVLATSPKTLNRATPPAEQRRPRNHDETRIRPGNARRLRSTEKKSCYIHLWPNSRCKHEKRVECRERARLRTTLVEDTKQMRERSHICCKDGDMGIKRRGGSNSQIPGPKPSMFRCCITMRPLSPGLRAIKDG